MASKPKRCQFVGPKGENLDDRGRCKNDATRQTDGRALDDPTTSLDLCQEHHEFVKAYFLAQAAAQTPTET